MFAAEARGDLPEGTAERWARHTKSVKRLPDRVGRGAKKKAELQGGHVVSTEANAPAAGNAEQAYDRIMDQVYRPVFFNKLASYGVVPGNTKEAEQLLYLGAQMFARHREKLAAEADARGTFLDFAVARLDGSTQASGGFTDAQVKQASAAILGDGATLAAALTLVQALDQAA